MFRSADLRSKILVHHQNPKTCTWPPKALFLASADDVAASRVVSVSVWRWRDVLTHLRWLLFPHLEWSSSISSR
jgi:hypothetical protein